MILVDTSVWIEHFRTGSLHLQTLLVNEQVFGHPLIAGELAVGNLVARHDPLKMIDGLETALVASNEEVRQFLELHSLFGRGVGFIDLHLLLSVRLTPDALLWTRDKRLHGMAKEMSVAYVEPAALTQ